MSLKPGRLVRSFLIDYIYDDTITADVDNGGIVTLKTGGSGEALDSSAAVVSYSANGSGLAAMGVLVPTITTANVSTIPQNFHKNAVPKGSKVELINEGWVVTNKYLGTPTAGSAAQLAASGFVALGTHSQTVGNVVVGYFMSNPDEDGYVKLWVDLPAA